MSSILSLIREIVSSVSDIDTVVAFPLKKDMLMMFDFSDPFLWLDGKCICYYRRLFSITAFIRYLNGKQESVITVSILSYQ